MTQTLDVLIAQINTKVGAIEENTLKITEIIVENQAKHDLIVFPELCLSGYPPEDLLFHAHFQDRINKAIEDIAKITTTAYVILGHPSTIAERRYNTLSVIHQGRQHRVYHKQHLPNYGVFDELRYFNAGGNDAAIISIKGYRIGLCICEDLWQEGPGQALIKAGIDILLSINASPFDTQKHLQRERLMRYYAVQGVEVLYVNAIGGQDELVFDGQSFVMDKQGDVYCRLPACEEKKASVHLFSQSKKMLAKILSEEESIYKALVLGLADYIHKNHFPGVLIGLSGGIDSALTLCIAVDALGPERVRAVMLPSRYTASMSFEDAESQIAALGVESLNLSIEPLFKEALNTLKNPFSGYKEDTTEENIQARLRGLLLMALSNKTGYLVLTTSNKSETAVGYSTLYGDMAGGFCVLKDVLKTQVYALAKYRNARNPVIPERVLERAPSAELSFNQTDQDSLPDYATLDKIIECYVEKKWPLEKIIQQGIDRNTVVRILHLIHRNEYKRKQAPLGTKISALAFGRDWRYPITAGFHHDEV